VILVEPVLAALVQVDALALERPEAALPALLFASLLELREGLLA
jgi:hypothetical protein